MRPRVSKHYGYGVLTQPGERTIEEDTFTCVHCNAVQAMAPYFQPSESGGWCRQCNGPVCNACAGKPCRPFEKWLDEVEKKAQRERFVTSILG